MTKNMIYKYEEKDTRVRVLASSVESGTPVLDPNDGRPAVTLTNTGDYVSTVTNADIPLGGGVTSFTYPNGGVGLVGKEATLAYNGTWELPVTGATTNTAQGADVYITSGGTLTTTEGTNTIFGVVDYPTDYHKRAGVLPVRIGD